MDEAFTESQAQRAKALEMAAAALSARGVLMTKGQLGCPPGDLVRTAHWIYSGEHIIVTDEDTVVMRDDAGWTRISTGDPEDGGQDPRLAGSGFLFWAPTMSEPEKWMNLGSTDEGFQETIEVDEETYHTQTTTEKIPADVDATIHIYEDGGSGA